MKYKIIQVTPRFSPKHGGGGLVVTSQISKALTKRGHHVVIVTSDYELDRKYIEDHKGIKVIPFYSWFNLSTMHFTLGMGKEVKKLVKNADIIHLQSYRMIQNIFVCYYARKYNVPYILEAHGMTPNFGGLFTRFLKWLWDVCFGNRILKGASMCLAETNTGIEEFEAYGINKEEIYLISPPRDLSEFDNLPLEGLFRKKWSIKEKNIVMFLGGIVHLKGIDFLIKSFAKLLEIENDSILVIVGPDHGFRKELEQLVSDLGIKEKVLFTGPIFGKDKLAGIRDTTIMAMPSRQEQGLPFSGLEALMCDVPVIVSKQTGAGDDITLMKGGYVVDFGNVKQMVKIMEEIIKNPSEAKKITVRGKKYIRENMSMETKIREYENIYERCIGE